MIHTNLPLSYIGTFESEIKLGYGIGIPSERYIYRDALVDSIHNQGAPEYHTDYPFLVKNKNRNVLLTGAWEISWEWNTGEFTEAEIDQFMAEPLGHPNTVMTKDFANNRVTATISQADIPISTWADLRHAWVLGSSTARITSKSNNAGVLCVTILNNNYEDYTIESIAVEPGTSVTVDKTGASHCYIVLSSDLVKDGVSLEPFKAYKVTSESLSLANTGVDRTRIVRISK